MYLIDANICIYLIKSQDSGLRTRFEGHRPFEIRISAISVAELEYGAAKSNRVEQNRTALRNFLSSFQIIEFDDRDAEQFGVLRAHLESAGTVIGPYDMEIAAQGLAGDLVVVTNNESEFNRVPGLTVENWLKAQGGS